MKSSIHGAILLAMSASIAWCAQQQEIAVTEVDQGRSTQQKHQPKEQHKHRDHGQHHAFADPAKNAQKWNGPERDKWQHPEKIVKALALTSGDTVADIGAGTGYMVVHLSQAVGAEGTVIAIDSSSQMIQYLAERSAKLGPANVVPRKVGGHDPELGTATVDAVLTLDTWHHIDEREVYARKVYAGLKRGGRFVVVDYAVDATMGPPQAMRLSPEQVTKQLEAARFRTEIVRDSMPHHYLVVGYKD